MNAFTSLSNRREEQDIHVDMYKRTYNEEKEKRKRRICLLVDSSFIDVRVCMCDIGKIRVVY
jgi:hypothetical protein